MINENITFDCALELVKKEVDRILSTSPNIIRDYTEHLALSRGKFIRAISLLACAEKTDGFIHPDAIKLAASIEILHLATLVHDDVIDNSDKRRGIITLQKKFGKRSAVICGDFLLCIALKLASTVGEEHDYKNLSIPDYMNRVCLGELNQHINNGNLDLSVFKYLKIISGKTAALFEAAFFAGAVLSECNKRELNEYRRLGRYIGMIFQLTDDCMDYETSENVAKKPVQSDYEQGVITLPLIFAFNNMKNLKEKAKSSQISKAELNESVKKIGGINYTLMIAKKYYNKSIKEINQLNITEDKSKRLVSILDKAYKRI